MVALASNPSRLPKLSVVVPFFNEEDNIEPLYRGIVSAVASLQIDYEVVFVDDGSRDGTHARAVELARHDARLKVVRFRRNYGQTAAMAAGIEYASGEIIVTMDGDLQNDPADIGQMLATIEDGFDIVVGWRHRRQDRLITRKIPSKVANWIIGRVTGVPIHDNGCSLKAFRARIIKRIPLYSEMHRFIPAMASLAGPRIAEIKVRHHPRRYGRSKYGLSRTYKVLMDLAVIKTIASFTARPLLWFGLLAMPLLALGSIALMAGCWPLLTGGTASLALSGSGAILMSSVFFLLAGGMLGELIYRSGDVREYEFALLMHQRHKAGSHDEQGSSASIGHHPGGQAPV